MVDPSHKLTFRILFTVHAAEFINFCEKHRLSCMVYHACSSSAALPQAHTIAQKRKCQVQIFFPLENNWQDDLDWCNVQTWSAFFAQALLAISYILWLKSATKLFSFWWITSHLSKSTTDVRQIATQQHKNTFLWYSTYFDTYDTVWS